MHVYRERDIDRDTEREHLAQLVGRQRVLRAVVGEGLGTSSPALV